MERNFFNLLKARWDQSLFVCVGLDIEYEKIPRHILEKNSGRGESMTAFGCEIVDATHDLVSAYKPNSAFFEAGGAEGMRGLFTIIEYIKKMYPDIPIIDEAKRGDIGSTSALYARGVFDVLGCDPVTLHPYLGKDALQPILDRKEKGCIILCRTSNPGANEFQDFGAEFGKPLWQKVAENVRDSWNEHGNCLLVVGATYPEEMKTIRSLVGDIPFLIPGIGKQGGDIHAAVNASMDSKKQGMIINSSRSIIYASSGEDFAEKAREETLKLHTAINAARNV